MPEQTYHEGQRFRNAAGEQLVYRNGQFIPVQNPRAPPTMEPDAPSAPLTGGSQTGAIGQINLGSAVRGQRVMLESEDVSRRSTYGNGPFGGEHPGTGNPARDAWASEALRMIPGIGPAAGGLFDIAAGNNNHLRYNNGRATFIGAFAPIMAGQAQSAGEIRRQIEQYLPDMTDTPEILQNKAEVRAMMLNGVADLTGRPRPYPDIGTIDPRDVAALRSTYAIRIQGNQPFARPGGAAANRAPPPAAGGARRPPPAAGVGMGVRGFAAPPRSEPTGMEHLSEADLRRIAAGGR